MEKERRTKALAVVVLLIVVAGLTVAFAALSTTLNINGTAYLDAAKWGIKFKNLSNPTKIGSATTTGTAKIEEAKSASITGMNVGLSTPGDKVTYTVDLVNEGTINAKIDNIGKTVLTSEQQRYLTFKVTDKDGREVSEGDILSAGETKKITITIEFINDLTKEDLPKQTSTISLSYKLNFVQTDEKATTSGSSKQACTVFDKKGTYNVGDVIALCNTSTNKSEDFYVMKDNGTTVTALAKYNLLIGNNYETDGSPTDSSKATPISSQDEGYGLQSNLAKGITGTWNGKYGEELEAEFDKIAVGTIQFSSNQYWGSSTGNIFNSNSSLYAPLENYKTYLTNTLGKSSATLKIITFDDLLSLGCDGSTHVCTNAPSWVYSTSYWTQTKGTYSTSLRTVTFWGEISDSSYDNYFLGLRPVITIKKSEL